jgi:hypothetical protein
VTPHGVVEELPILVLHDSGLLPCDRTRGNRVKSVRSNNARVKRVHIEITDDDRPFVTNLVLG